MFCIRDLSVLGLCDSIGNSRVLSQICIQNPISFVLLRLGLPSISTPVQKIFKLVSSICGSSLARTRRQERIIYRYFIPYLFLRLQDWRHHNGMNQKVVFMGEQWKKPLFINGNKTREWYLQQENNTSELP
jgi:hypothetical protein